MDKQAATTTHAERALAMAAKYRSGATLQEIGDYYSLTRERVRQILSYDLGLTRTDGGQASRTAARKAAAAARREQNFIRKYGMTESELRRAQSHIDKLGGQPMDRYRMQKRSASTRGIPWRLTFAEWWLAWTQSGKYAERGRGQGYCMARYSDKGAYEIGNIKIILAVENNSEFMRRYLHEVKTGKRPPTKRRARSTAPSESKFGSLVIGETRTFPITKSRKSAQTVALAFAKTHGQKFTTSAKGGVLTVTRLS